MLLLVLLLLLALMGRVLLEVLLLLLLLSDQSPWLCWLSLAWMMKVIDGMLLQLWVCQQEQWLVS